MVEKDRTNNKKRFPLNPELAKNSYYRPRDSLIAYINPQDFLDLAEPTPEGLIPDAVKKYEEKIKHNEPIPLGHLVIEQGEVVSHEGRHRAKAFQNMGFTEIPVILAFNKEGYIYRDEHGNSDIYLMDKIQDIKTKDPNAWIELLEQIQTAKTKNPTRCKKEKDDLVCVLDQQHDYTEESAKKNMKIRFRIRNLTKNE